MGLTIQQAVLNRFSNGKPGSIVSKAMAVGFEKAALALIDRAKSNVTEQDFLAGLSTTDRKAGISLEFVKAFANNEVVFESKFLTDEQLVVLVKCFTGRSVKVEAYAGTSKTFTMLAMMKYHRLEGGLVSFGKRDADTSKKRALRGTVSTIDSKSFSWFTKVSGRRPHIGKSLMTLEEWLSLVSPRFINISAGFSVSPIRQKVILEALVNDILINQVSNDLASSASRVNSKIVSRYLWEAENKMRADQSYYDNDKTLILSLVQTNIARLDADYRAIVDDLVPVAEKIVNAVLSMDYAKEGGSINFAILAKLALMHNMDLRQLGLNYVVVDEAQDCSLVFTEILMKQSIQVIAVGDHHQQIYQWRGATNALDQLNLTETCSLSIAYRYSPEVAKAATNFLKASKRLQKMRPIVSAKPSNPGSIDLHPTENLRTLIKQSDIILVLNNQDLLACSLETRKAGLFPVVEIAGKAELVTLIKDYYEFKEHGTNRKGGFFSEFDRSLFEQFEPSPALKTCLAFAATNSKQALMEVLTGVNKSKLASVEIRTVFTAKGGEWPRVLLFVSSSLAKGIGLCEEEPSNFYRNTQEINLFYIGITRGKNKTVVFVKPDKPESEEQGDVAGKK